MKPGPSRGDRRGRRETGIGALPSKRGLRLLAIALAVGVVGFGGGYLFSSRVLFPAPPPPGGLVSVPDLRGESLQGASSLLAEVGLMVGAVDSLRHPTVRAGEVLGQSPLPGQQSLVGDTVRVAISLGPEQRPVPDVRPLRGDQAVTVLETSGFSVRVDSVESGMPRGSVVGIDPTPGTLVTLPQDVRVSVSLGPPMVEVPLLLGLEEAEARELIDEVGLEVGEVSVRFRFGLDQGLVVEQEPPPGSMVRQGSVVRLVVGQRGGGVR